MPAICAVLFALALGAAPSTSVRQWSPAHISSEQFESHPAFDPRNGDLYFVRSSPQFKGWRLVTSHCTASGWSDPVAPPFAGDGVEADPFFTPDGSSLYFISNRTTDGIRRSDMDLWRVDRDSAGIWSRPIRLPVPLNSLSNEWYPRVADGWVYFGSERDGGLGHSDIWRAHTDGVGVWAVENLGTAVNSSAHEYEFLISPDGRRAVLMTDKGFYAVRRTPTGWHMKQRLGREINVNGTEIGALFSPSGRSLLFARDTKTRFSGELYVSTRGAVEAWPPSCERGKV